MMLTSKRVIIATICGLGFGIVCMLLAGSNPQATTQLTAAIKWTIIFSRALMGFTIGISALRLTWWIHGVVLGAVTSIPVSYTHLTLPTN